MNIKVKDNVACAATANAGNGYNANCQVHSIKGNIVTLINSGDGLPYSVEASLIRK